MQKIIILLIASSVLIISIVSANPSISKIRTLSFHYTKWEKSKDSNSHEYHIDLVQNKMSYSGPDPRTCKLRHCIQKKWIFTLSKAQQDQVWNMIQARGLFTQFSEKYVTRGLGYFADLTLQIKYGHQDYTIRLKGKTRNWGGSKGVLSEKSMQHLSALKSIQHLVSKWAIESEQVKE